MNMDIFNEPNDFRNLFYNEVSNQVTDPIYEPIFQTILYFVWIGITQTRNAVIASKINFDLGFLCLATYKSFLPIIQNTRLGYTSAVLILMRALIEQIALLGYLQENSEFIPRYVKGEDLQHRALGWAKNNTVVNWMQLYGVYSKVAHPMLENTSTNIKDESVIGRLIQNSIPLLGIEKDRLTDEILTGIIYSLMALDTFNEKIIGERFFDPKNFDPQMKGTNCSDNYEEFRDFLIRFVAKHKEINKNATAKKGY